MLTRIGVLAFVAAGAASLGPARADLIQHLPLDGDGTAAVGTSGTLTGTAAPAPDQGGNPTGAVGFVSAGGASGGYVDVPGGGGLAGLQTGTIAFFAKWNGVQDPACCGGTFGQMVARQSNGLFSNQVIGLGSADPNSGVVTVQLYSAGPPSLIGTTPVGEDAWRHVAVTYSSGQQQLYIDGNLDATSFATGNIRAETNVPLTLGAWIGDGAGYSTSVMDDFRVYDTILTQEEIQALIPEPAATGLLVLAGLGLLARRRRH